jgi:shikimate dehydrogenase
MVAGVVGDPVAHSLSPTIHGAWIRALGLDAIYDRFHVTAEGFPAFVAGARGGRLRGLNVTIPHKHTALALADEVDASARDAGAANLLRFHQDGRIEARNTDGLGLLAAFAEQAPGIDLGSGRVVVLGAGGAAKGAVAALARAGVADICIANRSLARAQELAAAFPGAWALSLADASAALHEAVALINATSRGLNGEDDLDLPLDALPAGAAVMDMVYKPLRTGLLRAAQARGLAVVDGLSMLIGQARPSFEAFYGVAPPAEVDVRALCLEKLGAGG